MARFRSYASRFRLRMVWMLTRHPRFKPLYYAETVSFDTLGQAEFLLQAGYYQAAAALARGSVENYVRRLSMICPNWGSCRAKCTADFACFLVTEGAINSKTRNLISLFYARASRIVHMQHRDHNQCAMAIHEALVIKSRCEDATRRVLGGMSGGAV